ncbi:MBL fold metallo-hydrolase [Alicyclobacillus cycloheptanicus]|uniref:Glyoxylase-like metal-dependent hydrolase (Beta-lactamase superfamily II) n=1 Tax=Alicyclobacillus cycloheptanicus TaxID=1457 RepID=A0ABT9XDN7_9BACL|nr:MBL fold metallo-hydrolase [Alicyclobacillus cycloheptanicus]MDQ0188407.1 glyoxylase-like metal-dependent hydrolase (beta-lactamase superfamily II) [Alicyclobacillus cycloheptanicus]WDM01112.1 MBL fold metallo-hydrolase [Alicyclobacillus cycloheptanicus]
MRFAATTTLAIHQIELPTPLPMGPVNAYLVLSGDSKVLVDAGIRTPDAKSQLFAALRAFDIAPSDLSGLVLTHGHVDHIGWTSAFRAEGVPVFAHPGVADWLHPGGAWDDYRSAFFRALYHQMGMPEEAQALADRQYFLMSQLTDRSVVDVPLQAGSAFSLLPGFEVLYVPGHAQAAIALWNPETGDCIIGDQLLPRISSNAVIEPQPGAPSGDAARRTPSLIQYRDNLTALRALPIQTVYPGHGAPFTDAKALIDQRLAEQVERRNEMIDLLKQLQDPPATAYDLAAAYFPHRLDQPPLILSETLGYLDWLAADGLVQSTPDDHGVYRWTVR